MSEPKSAAPPENSGECCAHLHVSYRKREKDGTVFESWWECDDSRCGTRFRPLMLSYAPSPPAEEPTLALDRARAVMIRALDALESDADLATRREAFEMIQEQFEGVSQADHDRAEALIPSLRGKAEPPLREEGMSRSCPHEFFEMPGLAGAIFDAQRVTDTLESVLWGCLPDFYERSEAENKRFDYYDGSVEWWVKAGSMLTDEERAILWTVGFSRCWLCVKGENGEQESETYYYDPVLAAKIQQRLAELRAEAAPKEGGGRG